MEAAPPGRNLPWRRRRSLVIAAGATIAAILGAYALTLILLYQNTLRDTQTNLLRQSLALSELAERTLQSVDLVLESVVEKLRPEFSGADPRELADREHHIFLKEKMAGLPQIDALGIIDVKGNRLNLSRDWPSAKADLSQREYFKELSANPKTDIVHQQSGTGHLQRSLGRHHRAAGPGKRRQISRRRIRLDQPGIF